MLFVFKNTTMTLGRNAISPMSSVSSNLQSRASKSALNSTSVSMASSVSEGLEDEILENVSIAREKQTCGGIKNKHKKKITPRNKWRVHSKM